MSGNVMRTRWRGPACVIGAITLAASALSVSAGVADPGDHLPPKGDNMRFVARLRLTKKHNAISDVTYHKGFAYVGESDGACPTAKVHVVDLSEPRSPKRVATIPSGPNDWVGEGVHVVSIDSAAFEGDVLLTSNEPCNAQKRNDGGLSLYDVTDPRNPVVLADGVGDRTNEDGSDSIGPHSSHNVFGWTDGGKSYAVIQDREEPLDVDILDISDPRKPRLISETGVREWEGLSMRRARNSEAFHHDSEVRRIDGHWYMIVSYWDAGWVLLDVDDPANPRFVDDHDYPATDPQTGMSPPEGNAHQATWSADNRFILGTDEDFGTTRLQGTITDGDDEGATFSVGRVFNSPPIFGERKASGPTVLLGRACDQGVPPAAQPDAIALIERGGCGFRDKVDIAAAAGYAAAIIFNDVGPDRCSNFFDTAVMGSIPSVIAGRDSAYRLLGVEGYDDDACRSGLPTPPLPAPGTRGADTTLEEVFDGWGYVHLLDAATLEEIDSYAIPESLDPKLASGFGDLSVHEVKSDPRPGTGLAYAAWYDGGARVLKFGEDGLTEVGAFRRDSGNDFYGVYPVARGERSPLLLFSDEDFGLYVLRYTGPQ